MYKEGRQSLSMLLAMVLVTTTSAETVKPFCLQCFQLSDLHIEFHLQSRHGVTMNASNGRQMLSCIGTRKILFVLAGDGHLNACKDTFGLCLHARMNPLFECVQGHAWHLLACNPCMHVRASMALLACLHGCM